MATKRQTQAMHLYAALMEEVKVRINSIDAVTAGVIKIFPTPILREFCFLQLRMICELIALGALTAHGDIQATQASKLQKEYSADRIMAQLEALHPDFYPQPSTDEVLPSGNRHFTRRESGFLTKAELLSMYHQCGGMLHRGSIKKLMSPSARFHSDYSDIVEWRAKLGILLGLHIVALLDGDTYFVCMLRNQSDNDRVQVAIAEADLGPPPSASSDDNRTA